MTAQVHGRFAQTDAGSGVTLTGSFSAAPTGNSGAQGLKLNRSTTGYALGIQLSSASDPKWDTAELDYDTTDLVLAYDHSIPGDVLRIKQGALAILGDAIGQPGTTSRLQLAAVHAADTATRLLYYSKSANAHALTHFVSATNDATTVHEMTVNGYTSFGRGYGGEFGSGSLEVQNNLGVFAANANGIIRLIRTGTSTQRWEIRLAASASSPAAANSIGIHDVTNTKRVFFAEPNAAADSLYIGTAGVNVGASGGKVGFYGAAPVALQTGVAVTAAGIHAALVNLGLITA